MKVAEVLLDNGDLELVFDGLMQRSDFDLIQEKFTKIEGVKIIKETDDETSRACLLSKDGFEFVLVYSTDSLVWNYVYALEKENHNLLIDLCSNFSELVK